MILRFLLCAVGLVLVEAAALLVGTAVLSDVAQRSKPYSIPDTIAVVSCPATTGGSGG